MIRNCLINIQDYVRADYIYGPAISLLKVGTKCHITPAKRVPRITLTTETFLHHKKIELYFYFYYMNGMPFIHKNSLNITFLTAEIVF